MNPIRRRPDANMRRTNGVNGPKRKIERVGKSRPKTHSSIKKTIKPRRRPLLSAKKAPIVPKTITKQPSEPREGTRLNKYLADQNVASRREVDVLIASKKVTINGKIAKIGDRVLPGDAVELIGETKDKRYLAYYKGRGIITHSPTDKEVDIATRLKKDYGITGLSPVGRLDKDSEGLIILTNDGRITGPLLDPEANHDKEYSVTVDKNVTPVFCKLMEMGVEIEDYLTKPAKVTPSTKNTKRFNIVITEGKKHQIRRMCAALGYQIESLKRVRIMNIEIGSLKPNQYRKLSDAELKNFLDVLGIN